MVTLTFKADFKALQKDLNDFQKKQVPFASALALTRLAQGVQAIEKAEMAKTFDTPTPFTLGSLGLQAAKKDNLHAIVYVRDLAEHYLEPYIIGGNRSMGKKKGMLVPKGVPVNQYGNLTKNKLATLKAKDNVFIGSVRFKSTGRTVSGVWQRSGTPRGRRRDGSYGTRGDSQGTISGARTTLKLLIRFEDSTEVPRRLPFAQAAQIYLNANTQREFDAALAVAMKPKPK